MRKIRIAAVAAVILAFNLLLVSAETNTAPVGYNQSLQNAIDFGAVPNDGNDDTASLNLALSGNGTVYLPAGKYEISEPLVVNYATIIGGGADKTVIVADMKSVRDPIIFAGGRTQIRDLSIEFAEGCVNGTEIAGERVGIYCSAAGQRRLCRGAGIMNVKINNVGTGLYSPLSDVVKNIKGTGNDKTGDGTAFSVTFESISVSNFAYRGFDMQAKTRTGNVYRNIYLSSGKYKANAGFYMNTEESECSITELTIADSKIKTPVRFNDCYALAITNINFINTELTQDNTGFVYFNSSVAQIGGINFRNTAPKGERQAFIRIGDNMYRTFTYDCAGYVHINNLNILNPDVTVAADSGQSLISRKSEYINDYTVEIDNYRIDAPAELKRQYETFKTDDKHLKVILGGTVKE